MHVATERKRTCQADMPINKRTIMWTFCQHLLHPATLSLCVITRARSHNHRGEACRGGRKTQRHRHERRDDKSCDGSPKQEGFKRMTESGRRCREARKGEGGHVDGGQFRHTWREALSERWCECLLERKSGRLLLLFFPAVSPSSSSCLHPNPFFYPLCLFI